MPPPPQDPKDITQMIQLFWRVCDGRHLPRTRVSKAGIDVGAGRVPLPPGRAAVLIQM